MGTAGSRGARAPHTRSFRTSSYRCGHVIDLHCHILPGIDDGPDTFEEALALARAAAATGTRTIVATPHVSWTYRNEPDTIARLTGELNERLASAGVPVEVRTGAEVAVTRVGDIDQAQLLRMRLGDGPWLLLEPPFTAVATGLDGLVMDLLSSGHRIVLAHPERCPAFHRDPRAIASLVQAGALTSITAGSLIGRFGGEVRRFARSLVEQGLVHNVASDAHDTIRRPPGMAAELHEAGLDVLAEWLTEAVPSAILGGTDVPAPPAPPPELMQRAGRARWWRRRSGVKRAWRSR